MQNKIKKLLADSTNELEKDILQDLADEENPEQYIRDLLTHGCVSGMVGKLIYYTDTKKYFSKFMDEIEELKNEAEEMQGEPLKIGSPIYNWLAWFGYEEMIRQVAYKLGIEI